MTSYICDRCKRDSQTRNMVVIVSAEVKPEPLKMDLCKPCVEDLTAWVADGAEQRDIK